jgi:hypothetical protein
MRASLFCLVAICVGGSIGCEMKGIEVTKSVEAPATSTPPATVPPAQQQGVAQKAEVGVGIKGDSLRDEEGVGKIIASPAVALFNTREKAVFEIQIPHALNLYKALEGDFPKTHEEFMEKIIKANAIQLPELKPGMQYRFRPDLGELWVEPISST